jgi:hypothetical protein
MQSNSTKIRRFPTARSKSFPTVANVTAAAKVGQAGTSGLLLKPRVHSSSRNSDSTQEAIVVREIAAIPQWAVGHQLQCEDLEPLAAKHPIVAGLEGRGLLAIISIDSCVPRICASRLLASGQVCVLQAGSGS